MNKALNKQKIDKFMTVSSWAWLIILFVTIGVGG